MTLMGCRRPWGRDDHTGTETGLTVTPESSEGKCEQQMERLVVIRMARSQVPCVKTLSPKETGFFPDVANSPRTGRSEVKSREGQLGKWLYSAVWR